MYEVDDLAGLVPLAAEKEQLALTNDIAKNGQQEAAVLWQNKLVDGRCRQLACHALGIELKVRSLDDNLSRAEVALIVKSLNTRRNLTMTQKIASAYKQQLKTKDTNEVMAVSWGISPMSLKNFKYIAKYLPSAVDPLFDGNTVDVLDVTSGVVISTNKVNTLARLIKKNIENGVVIKDTSNEIEFTVDGQIKTEAGKDWYYSVVAAKNITDIEIRKYMAELANYKYKIQEGELV
jgi:hypothetical protein